MKICDGDGFDFHFVLLPKAGEIKFHKYSKKDLNEVQWSYYDIFRKQLSCVIKRLDGENISRNTFKKNVISDIRKLYVLPDDRQFILQIMDLALSQIEEVSNFEPVLIAFKFGDRDRCDRIDLKNVFEAARVTVHVALTISSPILNQSLFWSRFGIQDLVGERGNIVSALSISSCANFQSNLDGRGMDITADLRKILLFPNSLTFIQFYADTPHLHSKYLHPVFGAIVSCGMLHEKVQVALENHARNI
ncbi:unnamed protein product [Mytilus edulis]|uniref:Uncharacterized protein n=1 Tax=Mytilus edulis TaxID=6550 RepID=A0A8S3QTU7_MYTED|nr:unnamed protein product [Mytilus edulis]